MRRKTLVMMMRKFGLHHSIRADVAGNNRQGLEGWAQLPRASLKPPGSLLKSSPTGRVTHRYGKLTEYFITKP